MARQLQWLGLVPARCGTQREVLHRFGNEEAVMATMKENVTKAGHKVAEKAKEVGNKISEGAEKATDWAKEKMHQAGNRADEAAQKAGHATERAGEKTKDETGGGCCSGH